MIEANHTFASHFSGVSTYQISVQGYLEESWSDRLAGMNINHHESETGPFSTLTGKIVDQSELLGVLNALNDYQYTIISVNKVSN